MGGSFKKIARNLIDPSSVVLDQVSDKNALKGALNPGGIALKNVQEGNVHNAADITNPDGSIRPTSQQQETRQAQAAFELDAPNRAANAATDAANAALITARRKRQQSQLATGATSGGGQLSSSQAYGKSTLG